MTAQMSESILYNGQEYGMTSEPLSQYLEKLDPEIRFVAPHTACWRGYFGTWEIVEEKLYLIELRAYINNFNEVGLDHLFPDQTKVFAEWFTGEIRIPQGEMLNYIHMGYASVFERDLFLEFSKGVLINSRVVNNE